MVSITFAPEETQTIKKIVVDIPRQQLVGKISLKPKQHEYQRDGRMWLWFPLIMKSELFGTLPFVWLQTYPRIIQWEDGKYYVFAGTHSQLEEFERKTGEDVVFYKEILIENGEKIEYTIAGN
jgi:hypothetical protein